MFELKIEETNYSLWLGENAPILLFEALGISLENALTDALNEVAIAESLTPQNLFNKLKSFEVRHAIAKILLQEGEFTPNLSMDAAKLARRLEINSLLGLIGEVFSKYNNTGQPVGDLSTQPVVNIAEGE